ncbi:single-stranded-DNA-specific exonuclease RecJ [Lacticigenium naphthae]|uniref:single-stranded-DNA-specific exonuclease RecJ n=1 Tax=Lacticigenium naphthae TaxID=515351 RepID=UPI00040014C5|nr:single-stranded-DNA-specific exonuclease RecJ [Lacticigenium naphthae]
MMESKKEWNILQQPNEEDIEYLMKTANISRIMAIISCQRGHTTKEKLEQFTEINPESFHDPFLFFDMEKAVKRIEEALIKEEKITVYGDYDADGVTSTAILYETLLTMGAEVDYYIPNRFEEGYGPNVKVFEKIIESGTSLILTCDNGIAGHAAIRRSNEMNIDVIVTDHHAIPDDLPEAYAIIHPRHPSGEYPFGDLAGAGVAFKLASALLGEVPLEFFDLVALGTIADLVSIVDENRLIVKQGLKMLQKTKRLGLHYLFDKIQLDKHTINEKDVGFKIGPRLNAVGRLGDAKPAVELLTTIDPEKGAELVEFIESQNIQRKAIVESIAKEAKIMIENLKESKPVFVLAKEGWHEGVLGIVASRIVAEYNKPTILLSINTTNNKAKGSARSIDPYNLYEAISPLASLTTAFGGHHMAAGLSLPIENLTEFENKLNEQALQRWDADNWKSQLTVDASIQIKDITIESIQELNKLAPFGTGNPQPTFLLENLVSTQVRQIGADKNHLKFSLSDSNKFLDVIGFQFGKMYDYLDSSPKVSVIGKLDINEWNGNKKTQLMLEDLLVTSAVIIDRRTKSLKSIDWSIENSTYIFFQKELYAKYKQEIPTNSNACNINELTGEKDKATSDKLIFVDCPHSVDDFKTVVSNNTKSQIICYFYSENDYYVNGLPKHSEFKQLYKYLGSHKNVDLNSLSTLSKFMKINIVHLKFMISVFFDANFVKMEDGLVQLVNNPSNKDLADTKSYKIRTEQMKAEEFLLYSHFESIVKEIENWQSVPVS